MIFNLVRAFVRQFTFSVDLGGGGGTVKAGFALDTKASGSGLIRLSHHVSAVYADPLTDAMFMVLDSNTEPTDVDLPVASSAVTPTTTTIFQWDAHATNKIVYRWTGKLNLLPYSTALHFAKVEAEDFTNLLSRVYAGSSLLHEKVATSNDPYRIPGLTTYATYWSEVMGTSTVRTHQIASTVTELD